MKFLWCSIALAVLSYCECQLAVHTPVHYVSVTPAPRIYYQTQSPSLHQAPIHVTIENDIVYADKETRSQPAPNRVHYQNPGIISRTFHGKPNLSQVSTKYFINKIV
jgi:hypothetical protein